MAKTILVVDDPTFVRTMVPTALESAGYGVMAACDGRKVTVDATNQIASKIGIIEDFAYPTNILALNSASESAGAGEHDGRNTPDPRHLERFA